MKLLWVDRRLFEKTNNKKPLRNRGFIEQDLFSRPFVLVVIIYFPVLYPVDIMVVS